jgi:hypothetical protein
MAGHWKIGRITLFGERFPQGVSIDLILPVALWAWG